uniref:Uncharacterized protein n=1 Tax=Ditylenchus dipsaci TaxID=166011 RepID=A0A915E5K4_9BILA
MQYSPLFGIGWMKRFRCAGWKGIADCTCSARLAALFSGLDADGLLPVWMDQDSTTQRLPEPNLQPFWQNDLQAERHISGHCYSKQPITGSTTKTTYVSDENRHYSSVNTPYIQEDVPFTNAQVAETLLRKWLIDEDCHKAMLIVLPVQMVNQSAEYHLIKFRLCKPTLNMFCIQRCPF